MTAEHKITDVPTTFPVSIETLGKQIPLRHSVRSFTDQKVEGDTRDALKCFIDACNEASGLSLQLITDEPGAFSGMLASYGKFANVRNYIACVGPKDNDLQEKVGYWGELVVLAAQSLGLNTCWVALTYSKRKVRAKVERGQKLVVVIALGYGTTSGRPRKSKTVAEVTQVVGDAPQWFYEGVEAALLAPTAVNQQKFKICYNDGDVKVEDLGGAYSKVDLGIVKSHFEIGRAMGRQ